MPNETHFLDYRFLTVPQDEAVSRLLQRMEARRGGKVYFVNANSVVIAHQDPELRAALHAADLILADGSGVLWGSALQGRPLRHNLNGTDLVPRLCAAAGERELSVYLLGGKPGVAERAAEQLAARSPGLKVAGTQHGYYAPEEEARVLAEIRDADPHLLLVAKGSPLQERWIHQHQRRLPRTTCLGVGGLFDFAAQNVVRAPRWVRGIGMEWVWRMAMEPRRLWRRYLVGNCVYLSILLQHSLTEARRGGAPARPAPERNP